MSIRLKRAYDPPAHGDGVRILVDRVWPRGVRKDDLRIEQWLKDIAPSAELRKWFRHDPTKWEVFKRRYFDELASHSDEIAELRKLARKGDLTLVYAAKDQAHNNAVALKEYLRSA